MSSTSARHRPATLIAAVVLSAAAAVLTMLGSVVAIARGRESIGAFAAGSTGDVLAAGSMGDLLHTGFTRIVEESYQLLLVRAVIGLVVAIAVPVVAPLALSGSRGARLGLVAALVASALAGSGLTLLNAEVLPRASVTLAEITPILSLAAIGLLLLPRRRRVQDPRDHEVRGPKERRS